MPRNGSMKKFTFQLEGFQVLSFKSFSFFWESVNNCCKSFGCSGGFSCEGTDLLSLH
jgi:hypothetical protein